MFAGECPYCDDTITAHKQQNRGAGHCPNCNREIRFTGSAYKKPRSSSRSQSSQSQSSRSRPSQQTPSQRTSSRNQSSGRSSTSSASGTHSSSDAPGSREDASGPERAYEKWTDEEEKQLVNWKAGGISLDEIASRLKRSKSAVRSRLRKVDYSTKKSDGAGEERKQDPISSSGTASQSTESEAEKRPPSLDLDQLSYGELEKAARELNIGSRAESRAKGRSDLIAYIKWAVENGHVSPTLRRIARENQSTPSPSSGSTPQNQRNIGREKSHSEGNSSGGLTKNVLAGLASFLIAGLGQLAQGRPAAAVIHFVLAGVVWGFSFGTMGWLVHLYSAYDAGTWSK